LIAAGIRGLSVGGTIYTSAKKNNISPSHGYAWFLGSASSSRSSQSLWWQALNGNTDLPDSAGLLLDCLVACVLARTVFGAACLGHIGGRRNNDQTAQSIAAPLATSEVASGAAFLQRRDRPCPPTNPPLRIGKMSHGDPAASIPHACPLQLNRITQNPHPPSTPKPSGHSPPVARGDPPRRRADARKREPKNEGQDRDPGLGTLLAIRRPRYEHGSSPAFWSMRSEQFWIGSPRSEPP